MKRLSFKYVQSKVNSSCNGWLYLNAENGYYQIHEYSGQGRTSINRLFGGSLRECYAYWSAMSAEKYNQLGPYVR